MKNRFLKFFYIFCLTLPMAFSGCKTTQKVVTNIVTKQGIYLWNEPKSEKIGVTLGLIKTSLSQQSVDSWKKANSPSCYTDFLNSFNKNFYEMLINKGMNTLGPFANYDEMTYPEKKNSDLSVMPEFNIILSHKIKSFKQINRNTYIYTYEFSIGGTVDLTIIEPLSKEKMWVKKIELGDMKRIVTTPKIYRRGDQIYLTAESLNDVTAIINNTYVDLFTEFFNNSYTTFSKYFNSEEMTVLKKQSQELRIKKNY